ncbi:hypothetical protein [Streptomyces sp. GC420]|uniref:hypothetical protein n=1 Tax=Streptomyces sp. GC420 TaxID=2697568 RepID=UPI001415215E|nr:hypothetical protein [Streptomyces sp. GC420]NBM15223.1 hypothetical protein [Streptomyces sp. GC420]
MKQSAAKTLGVAVLGAAFAAAAAGTAAALPLPVPGADAVTGALPAGNLPVVHNANTLPAKAHTLPAKNVKRPAPAGALGPVTGLLGGLPTQGLGVNGLPLG